VDDSPFSIVVVVYNDTEIHKLYTEFDTQIELLSLIWAHGRQNRSNGITDQQVGFVKLEPQLNEYF